MTQPISSSTHHEKLWCDQDDEPNVCTDKSERARSSSSTPPASDSASVVESRWDEAIEASSRRKQNFGAYALASTEAEDRGLSGARGGGHGPPDPTVDMDAELPPEPKDGRGPGIALGVQAGAAAGIGPGVAASIEVGLYVHTEGVAFYSTSTKLPTHCENADGDPVPCSEGIGAAAGFGPTAHLVLDGNESEGDGRSATLETPVGTAGISYVPDEVVTSIDISGPSLGAAAHADHVRTEYYDLVGGDR